MKRRLLFAIAAGLTLCLAATAGAVALNAPQPESNMSVSAKGLDLSNAYDADLYLNRIEAAARHVCRVDLRPHPLSERLAGERCVHEAMRQSVAHVEAQAVAARYANRGDTIMVAARI
ncbi:MAG: UrcA family protein [Pseudomonadota bacterium]